MVARIVLNLGLLIALPWAVLCQIDFTYDCRRNGYNALCTANTGATCDTSTGSCTCPAVTAPNFNNYFCNIYEETADCPSPCENGGTCSNGNCICTEGFYGTDCAMPRAQVFCDSGKMFINVNPQGTDTFQGYIGVLNYQAVDACQLKAPGANPIYGAYVTDSASLEGRNLEIPNASTECGDADETASTDPVGVTFTRKFIVQYNTDMVSSIDQIITGTCLLLEGSSTILGEIASVQGTDVATDISGLDVSGEVGSVTFTVVDEADALLTGEVNIGKPMKLKFTLATGDAYADFKVDSCDANNAETEESGNRKTLTFISAGCPSQDNLAMFNGAITKVTTSEPKFIDVPLKVFRFFGTSATVAFSCTVTLCKTGQTENCADSTCTGISAPSSSRRKRDVSDHQNVTTVITVKEWYRTEEDIRRLTEEMKDEDCMDDPEIIALVVILSVAVALLLVLSTILLLRLVNRRSKVSNVHPPSQRSLEPTMHIPRLEFNHHQQRI